MEDLLDELYILTLIEQGGVLNDTEKSRYMEIYNLLTINNINIPFGIEI